MAPRPSTGSRRNRGFHCRLQTGASCPRRQHSRGVAGCFPAGAGRPSPTRDSQEKNGTLHGAIAPTEPSRNCCGLYCLSHETGSWCARPDCAPKLCRCAAISCPGYPPAPALSGNRGSRAVCRRDRVPAAALTAEPVGAAASSELSRCWAMTDPATESAPVLPLPRRCMTDRERA